MAQFRLTLFALLLCLLTFGECSFQQSKLYKNKTKNTNPKNDSYYSAYKLSRANWKTAAIILVGVGLMGAIFYGSNCFYVGKIIFCENTERKYTRMDITSSV